MKSSLIVRPVAAADEAAIALLHAESWRSTYRGILPDRYLDQELLQDRKDHWARVFAGQAGTHITHIAELAGQPAGFICIRIGYDEGYDGTIDNLHISPELTGSGIGRRLLISGITAFRDAGGRSVCLWVFDANEGAVRFYERLGGTVTQTGFDSLGGGKAAHRQFAWDDPNDLIAACIENRES